MKHFLIFTLLCVMLGGALTATWADTRTKNVNKNWGTCTSTDKDGPLSADASITVDVDYPGEGKNLIDKAKSKVETILKGYAIQYEASASVFGTAPNDDYKGESELWAEVPEDSDHKPRKEWRVEVKDKAKAKYRHKLPKDHNWGDVHANNELSRCNSFGDVNGSSPEKGEWVVVEEPVESQIVYWLEWRLERKALSHAAFANAWNFPDEGNNGGGEGGAEEEEANNFVPPDPPTLGITLANSGQTFYPGDSLTLDLVTAEPFYNVSWYVHMPWDTSSSGTYQYDSYGDGTATAAWFSYTFPTSGTTNASGDYLFRALIYRWSDMAYVGEQTYTVTVQ